MRGEVTFDLVMDDDMSFVEGCYRVNGNDWEVFIVTKSPDCVELNIKMGLVWDSGVKGINLIFPEATKLNKTVVLDALSKALDIAEWSEVQGPDSMNLR
jgi:hypothetical protein